MRFISLSILGCLLLPALAIAEFEAGDLNGTYVSEFTKNGKWESCFQHEFEDANKNKYIKSYTNKYEYLDNIATNVLLAFDGPGCELHRLSSIRFMDYEISYGKYLDNAKLVREDTSEMIAARDVLLTNAHVTARNQAAKPLCGVKNWIIGVSQDISCHISSWGPKRNSNTMITKNANGEITLIQNRDSAGESRLRRIK